MFPQVYFHDITVRQLRAFEGDLKFDVSDQLAFFRAHGLMSLSVAAEASRSHKDLAWTSAVASELQWRSVQPPHVPQYLAAFLVRDTQQLQARRTPSCLS